MLVIDGSYLWHAARAPLGDAIPLPGAYNTPRVIRKLLKDMPEPYLIVWDHEKLRKQKLYPEYKKTAELPWTVNAKDYIDTIRLLHWLGAPQVQKLGWEADEAIAWWVRRLSPMEKVTVVSNDHDLFQVLDGKRVRMYRYTQKDWVEERDLKRPEILGWPRELASSAQALMGDSGDRVPGLFSERESRRILDALGSMAEWWRNPAKGAPEVPDKATREKLLKLAGELRRNWLLVDLSDPTFKEIHGEDRPRLLPAAARGAREKAEAYAKRKEFKYLAGKTDDFASLDELGREGVKLLHRVKTSEAVFLRVSAREKLEPMEILQKAMEEGKQVKMVYKKLDGTSDSYTVAPYQICTWGPRRVKVLFVHDLRGGRTKSFVLDNIEAVELLEIKTRPPRGGEVYPKTVKTPGRCDWKPRRRMGV